MTVALDGKAFLLVVHIWRELLLGACVVLNGVFYLGKDEGREEGEVYTR